MSKNQLHNRPELKAARRALRNNATSAEATLWRVLKESQLAGRKFRRQHSIGPFIVDFYCPAERLVVELDGAPHFTSFGSAADYDRDAYLTGLGFRVLRFEHKLVFQALEGVLEEIERWFLEG